MTGGDNGQSANQQPVGWNFRPNTTDMSATGGTPKDYPEDKEIVEWTASEYIAHQKHAGWYGQAILATVVVAVLVYLVTRDAISTGVMVFAGLLFILAAARKPKVLAYRADHGGLTIGSKYYPYSQFKSFAVTQTGALISVSFMPIKRFAPSVDLYIPPGNAEAIVGILSANLPVESRKPGLVDTFTHRIRF